MNFYFKNSESLLKIFENEACWNSDGIIFPSLFFSAMNDSMLILLLQKLIWKFKTWIINKQTMLILSKCLKFKQYEWKKIWCKKFQKEWISEGKITHYYFLWLHFFQTFFVKQDMLYQVSFQNFENTQSDACFFKDSEFLL